MTDLAEFEQPTAKLSDLCLEIEGLWSNPRKVTGLDKQSLRELAEDIKAKKKVSVPLMVQLVTVPGREAPLKLVPDGQRRYLAAEIAGLKEVPVSYRTPEPLELTPALASELLSEAMAVGLNRETLSSYEIALAAQNLKAAGKNGKETARVLRKSEAWISRMTNGLKKAPPEIIADWKAGKITDEQFKDLSDVKPEDQKAALAEVREAREKGDRAEARAKVKELAAKFKSERKPSKAELKRQAKAAKTAKPERKDAPAAPTKRTVAQLTEIARQKPATHDYAKGVIDGLRYALGELDESKLGKPWHKYIERAAGKPSKAKPAKGKEPAKRVSAKELAAKKKSKSAQRKADRSQVKKALAKAGKK